MTVSPQGSFDREVGRDGRGADSPTDIPAEGWMAIAKRVMEQVKEDKVPIVAGGLAFFTLLSLFPALIAFVSIYGLVADPATVTRQISELSGALPDGASDLISTQLQQIADTSSTALSWTAVGAIFAALWSASGGAQHLIRGLDAAYDEDESRGFFKLRGVSIVLTLVFLMLGAMALGLIVVVPPLLRAIAPAEGVELAVTIGRFIVLAALLLVALAVVYRYAPDREEPRLEWVSPGAVAAVVLWILASILFAVYVDNFGTFGETYGSLAGVVVLMLWFYISAFIVLLGAELNAEIERQTGAAPDGSREPMGSREASKADSFASER